MCDPTSLAVASLAMAAGGTAYGVSENISAKNAANAADRDAAARSNAARMAEMQRQDAYSKQAWDAWQAQLQRSGAEPVTQQIDQGAQLVTTTAGRATANSPLDMGQLPGSSGTEAALTEDTARRTAATTSRTRQQIAAMTQMAGFGNAAAAQGIQRQQFGSDLASLNGARSASLGIARLEGATIPRVAGTPSPLAGALMQTGQIGLQYAGSKGAYDNLPLIGTTKPAGTA